MQVQERKDIDVKRDMELVRELLIQIEEDRQLDGRGYKELAVKDHDPAEVAYTLNIEHTNCRRIRYWQREQET